jgi:hypothetical protein
VWSQKREQYSGAGSQVVSPEAAAAKFDQQQRLSEDEAMTLLLRAEFILKLEPNVMKVCIKQRIVAQSLRSKRLSSDD